VVPLSFLILVLIDVLFEQNPKLMMQTPAYMYTGDEPECMIFQNISHIVDKDILLLSVVLKTKFDVSKRHFMKMIRIRISNGLIISVLKWTDINEIITNDNTSYILSYKSDVLGQTNVSIFCTDHLMKAFNTTFLTPKDENSAYSSSYPRELHNVCFQNRTLIYYNRYIGFSCTSLNISFIPKQPSVKMASAEIEIWYLHLISLDPLMVPLYISNMIRGTDNSIIVNMSDLEVSFLQSSVSKRILNAKSNICSKVVKLVELEEKKLGKDDFGNFGSVQIDSIFIAQSSSLEKGFKNANEIMQNIIDYPNVSIITMDLKPSLVIPLLMKAKVLIVPPSFDPKYLVYCNRNATILLKHQINNISQDIWKSYGISFSTFDSIHSLRVALQDKSISSYKTENTLDLQL